MKKNILSQFVLHKTVPREVFGATASPAPAKKTSASRVAIDGWHRLRLWWERFRRLSRRAPRRLRLCESLPLGERRFVAVVEFERARFLVGGTTSSLVLLARLGTGHGHEETSDERDRKDEDQTPEKNENKCKDGIVTTALPATGISARFEP